jgi:hypothetical protein
MALEGNHSLLSILAFFDLGPEARPLSKPPIGNNMSGNAKREKKLSLHGTLRDIADYVRALRRRLELR